MAIEEAVDEIGGKCVLNAVASDEALGKPVDQLFAHHSATIPLLRYPIQNLALLFYR